MNPINDTSSQSTITNLNNVVGVFNYYITSNELYTNFYTKTQTNNLLILKQDVLTASTTLLGNGGSITAINWNNITTNKPTNFQADWNTTIINKPTTFNPDLTNIYTKTQVDGITTLTNFYNKTETDNLLASKQAILTAGTTLLGNGGSITAINWNNITTNKPTNFQADWNTTVINKPDLSAYLTTSTANSTYLRLDGSSSMTSKLLLLTGSQGNPSFATNNGGGGDRIVFQSGVAGSILPYSLGYSLNNLWMSVPSGATINTYIDGTIRWSVGSTGAILYGNLNASNIQEGNTNLSSKYASITALNDKENTLTFSAPLSRATNTISINLSAYSTTATNDTNYLRLAQATNDLNGKLAILNGNNLTTPQFGDYGGSGDRLILWKGNAGAYPYSLGMNGGTLWYSVPTGAIHNFYVNGVSECQINSNGLAVFGNVSTETFSVVDATSYTNQYQMFMLPPTSTTPARIQTIRQGIGYDQNLILQGENLSGNVGIGTLTNVTSKLTVNGNITATGTSSISANSFIENGVALSSKYLQSASLGNYLLKAGDTMTGDLTFNKTNLNIQLTATNGNNIAIPSTAGFFSTASLANDFVIRSINNLLLQCGGGDFCLKIGTNNYLTINKHFYLSVVPADNKATVEGRIIATGPVMATTFGGDVCINGYWGVAININAGGWANGNGGGNNTQSYISGYSAFTVNMRTGTGTTSFDKNLFTVRPSGYVGINTTDPNCHLTVAGIANIHNGSPYSTLNNYMQSGSLTIGGINANYGGGNNWNGNTAGLMMECQTYTEIAVHDAGQRIASFMYYVGDGTNQFYIGRNMGWGTISQTNFYGNVYLNNSLFLKTDVWNYSTDNKERIYFGNNGITYFRAYNNGGVPQTNCYIFRNNGGTDIIGINDNGNTFFVGEISAKFTTISGSYRDLLGCYVENTSPGNSGNYTAYLIQGTFTGIHRVFTEDPLFIKEEPQKFKDDYEGRIVIANGKIATDTNEDKDVWEIKYEKDGITIEDALPMIELSRKKKDKRVFGVIGASKRQTNRPERLIINSVGEGAIWICNSNGNIENGDFIQSSVYLGYGERQDDDLFHNYTVAKITIDCDFILDSPLYQCKEIDDLDENGNKLRVAFVSCVYHCG